MARYLNVNAIESENNNRSVMTLTINVDDREFEFIVDSAIVIAKIIKDVFRANPEKRIDFHISNRVIRIEEMREVVEQLYAAGVIKNQF